MRFQYRKYKIKNRWIDPSVLFIFSLSMCYLAVFLHAVFLHLEGAFALTAFLVLQQVDSSVSQQAVFFVTVFLTAFLAGAFFSVFFVAMLFLFFLFGLSGKNRQINKLYRSFLLNSTFLRQLFYTFRFDKYTERRRRHDVGCG